MRLIDADELKGKAVADPDDGEHFVYCQDIDEAPTVDAVPVVRCKDCVYSQSAKINKKGFLICPASGMEITDDDFCSYGERRKSNENHT